MVFWPVVLRVTLLFFFYYFMLYIIISLFVMEIISIISISLIILPQYSIKFIRIHLSTGLPHEIFVKAIIRINRKMYILENLFFTVVKFGIAKGYTQNSIFLTTVSSEVAM